MNTRLLSRWIATLLLLAASGCANMWNRINPWHQEKLNYQTVTAEPNRDPEGAKAENDKAMKALDRQRVDKAEQHLQQALIDDVTYGPAHNNLGQIYFCQSKYYLAAWEFEYALKLMPDRPEPYNNLGLVYEKVGKINEAIETYEAGLKLQTNNPELVGNLARARIRRGDAHTEIQPLLQNISGFDPRPEWVAWAKHQLVFPDKTTTAEPSLEVVPAPQGTPQPTQDTTDRQAPPKSLPKPPKTPKPDTTGNSLVSQP